MLKKLPGLPLLVAIGLVAGCGGDEPSTGTNPNLLCAGEDRADQFVAGLEKVSGRRGVSPSASGHPGGRRAEAAGSGE